MRALVNTRAGGLEVLKVEEQPDLMVTKGCVSIRVKRAGLNFADLSARVGLYPDAPKFPMTVGYEVAGVIDAVGEGVKGLAKGDPVVALCRFGGQATQAVVPAGQVRVIPTDMSFDEAAALPVNYLTAFHMLRYIAPLQRGMTVLIHMAAGGVGLAAIQLCRAVEGVTIIGTASAGKHEFLKAAGVHHCIDYRTQDYVEEVKRITGGRGVHRVLDALGGKDWSKGYSLLRAGGHLLCFGWANTLSGDKRDWLHVAGEFLQLRPFTPMGLMDKNRTVSGVNLGHLWEELDLLGEHLEGLLALYREGIVKPRVDQVFKLADAAKAHEYMQARKNVGKVVFDCE